MTTSDRAPRSSWFPDSEPAPPRTIDEALDRAPEATLLVVGAPRGVVAVEVRRALERGLDVLVVGEGLTAEEAPAERAFAAERGLLLLAGDARIDGVVLAGSLLDGAAGTLGVVASDVGAAVEATAAAERAGFGTSQVLVVGAGDLEEEGGGVASLSALARLGADPSTTAIVVVGAGEPRVLRTLQHACVATGKPAVICAFDGDARRGIGWEWIAALRELPRALVRLGADPGAGATIAFATSPAARVLGALGAASTAHEVIAELAAAGLDVASNVPRPGVLPEDVGGHTVLALADPAARAAWLRSAGSDPAVCAVIVDLPSTPVAEREAAPIVLVLGALDISARAMGRALRIVVARPRSAGGAPTALDSELAALHASVESGAASAARIALMVIAGVSSEAPERSSLAGRPLHVLTIAADTIALSLAERGVPVTPIAWSAPAGGDPRIARLVGLLR